MPRLPTSFLLDDGPPPMLAYDSASSSSSSSPSSPPPLRHRLRRHRSPSPASRHMSHLYLHHYFAPSPRPYSPSSREADIARLLDPAYASPAPHSPLAKSPKMTLKEVYVDHHGDLHDPDFRDFPPLVHTHMHSRQSRCDHGFKDDDDDVDDDDQVVHPRPSFERQPRRPSSSVTYSPPVYYLNEEPTPYESRYPAEDDDEEGDQFERTPLKESAFCYRPRSPAKRSKAAQNEKQSPLATEGNRVIQADSEWTPTCTQNLRRHWQAITLSLRFSLFRTKRRIRRRLTG